ncbi:MAG TPA: hypothetical protein VE733_30825 [Streptosporangiaceae bacterium]|nr:hypothetical protein [Streptosporangiaceae bacterium]
MSKRLTEDEFWHLVTLLQRYGETDLDQHDAWQLSTSYGPVFVRMTRSLPEGESADAYRNMVPPGQRSADL